MLTEQRYQVILKLLEEKGTVTVTELKDLLNTISKEAANS